MGKFLSGKVIDDPKLNALGAWFDEHRDEVDAECDEAEQRGEFYTLADLGAKDWNEGLVKLREIEETGIKPKALSKAG